MNLVQEYVDSTVLLMDSSTCIFKELIKDSIVCTYLEQIYNYSETTFKHSLNVYALSMAIGSLEWLSSDDIMTIGKAALLHDIGKLRIPQSILHKPSSLTTEEFDIMKSHVYKGCVFAEELGVETAVLRGILDHHERVDGSGYPQKSKGSCISEEGKIIAVADIYEALIAKREYKDNIDPLSAIELMENIKALNYKAFCFLKQIVKAEI